MQTIEKPVLVSTKFFVEILNIKDNTITLKYTDSFKDKAGALELYTKLKNHHLFKTGDMLRYYKEVIEVYDIYKENE